MINISEKIIKKLLFIFLLPSGLWGVTSYTVTECVESYYNLYEADQIAIPLADKDGRVQTLNRMGASAPVWDEEADEAIKAFIKYIEKHKVSLDVLDVGGCYGDVMQTVLRKAPQTHYDLNDLYPKHLFIAAKKIHDSRLPTHNIKFLLGNIVQDWGIESKYDAILIARVLHYLSPEQMNQALAHLYKLLKPGGKIFIIAITPYVRRFQKFIPEYEKRVKQGEPYPGYVTSLYSWLNDDAITNTPKTSINPNPFLFLDKEVLRKALKDEGFIIESCCLKHMHYNSPDWQMPEGPGEHIIAIARKPLKGKL